MSTLIKLEVAKKQAYIFASNSLKDNISRSNHIAYVTSNEFFEKIASDLYKSEENLVYSGGGHSVLKFETKDKAIEFTKVITKYVFGNFDGLELFSTNIEYDENLLPKENLMNLSKKLEEKKSIRFNQFEKSSIGIEKLNSVDFKPIQKDKKTFEHMDFKLFEGYDFAKDFKDFDENFIAVIHIDGNAMGKRIEKIYENPINDDFDKLADNLNKFSTCIQNDFETAFNKMLLKVAEKSNINLQNSFPVRPIILAGDDVCFVTKGSLGVECSCIFMEELAKLENEQDKTKYSACAGVAIVHTKFPFYKAYNLSEELCNSAKKFGISCNKDGSISAIDWHIEYGQMKTHLSEIREDYICEDKNVLTLRPMVVVNPNNNEVSKFREYEYFKNSCEGLKKANTDVNRGKLKGLRQSLKQGALEAEYFIKNKSLQNIIYPLVTSEYGENVVSTILEEGIDTNLFRKIDDNEYCVCFDAIEMMDIFAEIEEV